MFAEATLALKHLSVLKAKVHMRQGRLWTAPVHVGMMMLRSYPRSVQGHNTRRHCVKFEGELRHEIIDTHVPLLLATFTSNA